MRRVFLFIVHQLTGTIVVLALSISACNSLLKLYALGSGAPIRINFELGSFVPGFVFIGFAAGYAVHTRIGGRIALWVWIIPALVLTARILTFPSQSIFESGIIAGWKYFFDQVPCSSRNLLDLAPIATRCVSRVFYLGMPICALFYSAGARVSQLEIFPRLQQGLRKFGRKTSDRPNAV